MGSGPCKLYTKLQKRKLVTCTVRIHTHQRPLCKIFTVLIIILVLSRYRSNRQVGEFPVTCRVWFRVLFLEYVNVFPSLAHRWQNLLPRWVTKIKPTESNQYKYLGKVKLIPVKMLNLHDKSTVSFALNFLLYFASFQCPLMPLILDIGCFRQSSEPLKDRSNVFSFRAFPLHSGIVR